MAAGGVLLAGGPRARPAPRRGAAGRSRSWPRLALAVARARAAAVFRMRYARDSFLGRAQAGDAGYALEHVAWDPIARIEVSRVPAPDPEKSAVALALRPGPRAARRASGCVVTQNNNAFTYAPDYDGDPRRSAGPRTRRSTRPPTRRASCPRPRVLVVGVGGGVDVLTALRFDAASVTGVEVNGATLDDPARRLPRPLPARGWTTRACASSTTTAGTSSPAGEDRFDVIQLSGVDSVSGTPGRGARLLRELPLHRGGVRPLPLPPRARGRAQRHAAGVDPAARHAAARSRPSSSRSVGAASSGPAEHVMVVVDRQRAPSWPCWSSSSPSRRSRSRRVAAWAGANPYLSLAAAPGLRPLRAERLRGPARRARRPAT